MIIYISGTDTFRSKQYLSQTIEEFKKKRDPQGYNVIILDGKGDSDDRMLTEIRSAPFLAEKRLVIINNILSGNNKDLLLELIISIQEDKIPPTNVVVFWQGEALGRVKEIKELEHILKKQEYSKKFDLLKGMDLENWIVKETKDRGCLIDSSAVIYLARNAGYDMWFLNSLLNQLIAYKIEEICLSDIQLFLDEKLDDNAFNMVEAIVSGNKKLALKLLNEQRRLGEDEYKIFGLLIWQFRILIDLRDLFEREAEISSDDLARRLGIHPFVVKKNLYLVKRFTLSQLKNIHYKLLLIDQKTKTGFADQSLLIDLFVVS